MKVNAKKRSGLRNSTRLLQLTVFVLGCVALAYAFAAFPKTTAAEEPAGEPAVMTEPQGEDYSKFLHSNASHSRLPCLLCHRRDDNSTRIGFPGKGGHLPCAGCHTQQFADNTSPMCTICHTSTGMKRFPGLRSFSTKFDHGRHLRVSCSQCHRSSGRGVSLSIPSGANAHASCFQCHSSAAPANMSSCDTCHQPGRRNWTSEGARAFKMSFSHQRHVRGADISCANCHTIRPGAPRGRQVSSPLASMHFAPAKSMSCGGCHNSKKAFGADDFTNCKRCHTGSSFRF